MAVDIDTIFDVDGVPFSKADYEASENDPVKRADFDKQFDAWRDRHPNFSKNMGDFEKSGEASFTEAQYNDPNLSADDRAKYDSEFDAWKKKEIDPETVNVQQQNPGQNDANENTDFEQAYIEAYRQVAIDNGFNPDTEYKHEKDANGLNLSITKEGEEKPRFAAQVKDANTVAFDLSSQEGADMAMAGLAKMGKKGINLDGQMDNEAKAYLMISCAKLGMRVNNAPDIESLGLAPELVQAYKDALAASQPQPDPQQPNKKLDPLNKDNNDARKQAIQNAISALEAKALDPNATDEVKKEWQDFQAAKANIDKNKPGRDADGNLNKVKVDSDNKVITSLTPDEKTALDKDRATYKNLLIKHMPEEDKKAFFADRAVRDGNTYTADKQKEAAQKDFSLQSRLAAQQGRS